MGVYSLLVLNITGFNGSFKIFAYLFVGLPLYDPAGGQISPFENPKVTLYIAEEAP